jgi:hypothetical protein
MLFGAMAIALAITGSYAESVRGAGSGEVLQWLDAHGFVRSPRPRAFQEVSRPSLLFVTDQMAIQWLVVHSWFLALCAIGFALWAEFESELTQFLSAGFVFGALALMFFNPLISLVLVALGAVAVGWHRRRMVPPVPNPSIERTGPGKPGRAAHVER